MFGASLLTLALILCTYGLGVFHFRRSAIVQRSVDGHYDDRFGPTVLLGVMMAYFIFYMVFVSQISTVALATPPLIRVSDMQLSNQALSSLAGLPANTTITSANLDPLLVALRTNITLLLPQYRFQGTLNSLVETSNVTYFDTPTCTLRNNQFVMREIQGQDSTGAPAVNIAFSYQAGDLRKMSLLDSTFNATQAVASEHFTEGRQVYAQRTKLIPITSLSTPTLITTPYFFETFDLWEAVDPDDWTLPIVPRYQKLTERVYGAFSTSFGVPGRSGVLRVHVWDTGGNIVLVQLILTYTVPSQQTLTEGEIVAMTKFYETLQKSIGVKNGIDSVAYVYAMQPCI